MSIVHGKARGVVICTWMFLEGLESFPFEDWLRRSIGRGNMAKHSKPTPKNDTACSFNDDPRVQNLCDRTKAAGRKQRS
jgi:hypothetical protein